MRKRKLGGEERGTEDLLSLGQREKQKNLVCRRESNKRKLSGKGIRFSFESKEKQKTFF